MLFLLVSVDFFFVFSMNYRTVLSSPLAGDTTSFSGDLLSAKPSSAADSQTAVARPPAHATAAAGRYRPQRAAHIALPAWQFRSGDTPRASPFFLRRCLSRPQCPALPRPKASSAWRSPPPACEAAWPPSLPGRQTWPSTCRTSPR